jgi:hypothetical protein
LSKLSVGTKTQGKTVAGSNDWKEKINQSIPNILTSKDFLSILHHPFKVVKDFT